jgi:hypothetical protein
MGTRMQTVTMPCVYGQHVTNLEICSTRSLEIQDSIVLRGYARYDADTSYGDCGQLLIANMDIVPRKILGTHSALGRIHGQGGIGYATMIFKEDLESHLNRLPIGSNIVNELPPNLIMSVPHAIFFKNREGENVFEKGESKMPPSFLTFGKLPNGGTIQPNSISPSLIHGKLIDDFGNALGPTKFPVVTGFYKVDGVTQNPYSNAVLKNDTHAHVIDHDLLELALTDTFKHYDSDCDRSEITMFEACHGVPNNEYIGPLDRSKSCGYPLSQGKIGKTHYLGKGEDKVVTQELSDLVNKFLEKAEAGVREAVIFSEVLKPECRVKEKKFTPRLFSAGPLVYLVAFRMKFATFCAHLTRTRIRNSIAVGINHLTEWHILRDHLCQRGDRVFAGDFKAFDASLQRIVLHRIGMHIIEWYGPGSSKTDLSRITIWNTISDSYHLCNSEFYGWQKSLSSGNPITSIANSIYVSVAMRMTFLFLARKMKVPHMLFDDNVSMICYGDDNACNVADDVPWFNQNTVTEAMSCVMGMTYTHETKVEGSIPDYRTVYEISFLKRTFVNDPLHVCLAPLELSTIYNMPHWVRTKAHNFNGVLPDIIMNAMREMSLHPEGLYNSFRNAVQRAVRSKGLRNQVDLLSWKLQRAAVYSSCALQSVGEVKPYTLSTESYMEGESSYLTGDEKITLNSLVNALPMELQMGTSANHEVDDEVRNYLFINVCVKKQRSIYSNKSTKQLLSFGRSLRNKTTSSISPNFHTGPSEGLSPYSENSTSSSQIQAQEFVAFHDAAGTQLVTPDTIHKSMAEVSLETRVHDITNFLSRPIKIYNSQISTATANTFVTLDIPIYSQMLVCKLQGFRFFRANMHFKVVLNASVYATGRMYMWYSPQPTPLRPDPTSDKTRIYGYPGVEIDIGSGLTPQLDVPFIYSRTYLDQQTSSQTYAQLSITMINGLQGSSSGETCDVAVYAWFSEIDLGLPGPYPTTEVQSGENERRSNADTSTLEGARQSGNSFLTELTAPLHWLDKVAGGALSTLGLSKPQNLQILKHIANIPAAGYANACGVDSGVVLALSPDNSIACSSRFFHATESATDIAHIVSRSQFIGSYNYSTALNNNDFIATIPVGPFPRTTFIGYLLSVFSMWRGSLIYRISFVKNAFYSGRVAIEYISGDNVPGTSIAVTDFIPRKIIDLRTNNEVTVEIPFNNATPWYGCTQTIGRLYIRVLNPLRAPPNLPTTVDVNIYIAGGPDFAVSVPLDMNIVPQSGLAEVMDFSATDRDNSNAHKFYDIGGTTPASEGITIGESITNLKTLALRSSFFFDSENITPIQVMFDVASFGPQSTTTTLAYVSQLFRYWRGSVRWKIFMRRPPRSSAGEDRQYLMLTTKVVDLINHTPFSTYQVIPGINSSAEHRTFPLLNPVHEVTIPYYRNNTISVIADAGKNVSRPGLAIVIEYPDYDVTDVPGLFTIYVSAGDDYEFGFQLGPPAS